MKWQSSSVALFATSAVLLGACSSSSSKGPTATANSLVAAGLAAEHSGNVNQAFADYQAALAKNPNNKYAHYDLGYIYQQRGDSTNASAQYRASLLIDPKFTQALYNMGVLEAPISPATAISYYEQDLQVEPNNASTNFNLGVLLVKQGQAAQGESYLATSLRLNPSLAADIPPGIPVPPGVTTTTTKP